MLAVFLLVFVGPVQGKDRAKIRLFWGTRPSRLWISPRFVRNR